MLDRVMLGESHPSLLFLELQCSLCPHCQMVRLDITGTLRAAKTQTSRWKTPETRKRCNDYRLQRLMAADPGPVSTLRLLLTV